MEILFYILSAVLGAIVALGTYIFVRKILLKGQKEEIIKKAELEAESIKKEKIFQAKEKFLSLKSKETTPVTYVYEACTIPDDVLEDALAGTRALYVVPFL